MSNRDDLALIMHKDTGIAGGYGWTAYRDMADAILASDWLAEHDRQVAKDAPLVRAIREFYDRGEGVPWRDLQVLLAMSANPAQATPDALPTEETK